MREITEIQSQDLARLAGQAADLKQNVRHVIAEIDRDHYCCDDDTAWEITMGNRPSFLVFHLRGLLEVIVDDILDELEPALREAVGVTDAQLHQEWQEQQREWTGKEEEQAGPVVRESTHRPGYEELNP